MMKKQIVAAVLAVSVAGGVGTGFAAHSWNDDKPSASPTDTPTVTTLPSATPSATPRTTAPTATKKPTTAPVSTTNLKLSDFVLAPGQVGPAKAGMTKQQALATGLFDADVASNNCDFVARLQWKSRYEKAVDVLTFGNGEISSIGVWSGGPRTASGLGVGSTYAQIKAAYTYSESLDNDYGQGGVLVADSNDGRWIGFLFGKPLAELKNSDTVVFVEVTKGGKPGLLRDGC